MSARLVQQARKKTIIIRARQAGRTPLDLCAAGTDTYSPGLAICGMEPDLGFATEGSFKFVAKPPISL